MLDRWTRIVERQVRCDVRIGSIDHTSAITLLRQQHRAVTRKVTSMVEAMRAEIGCIDDGLCDRALNRPAEVHAIQREMQVCHDLLAWLDQRGQW